MHAKNYARIELQYKSLAKTTNILLFIIDHGGMKIHFTTVQPPTSYVYYSVPALIQKHLSFVSFSKWKGNKLRIKVYGIIMIKTKEIYTMYTMKWVVIPLEYIFIPPWLIIYNKQHHSKVK